MAVTPEDEFITLAAFARKHGKSRERARKLADAGRLILRDPPYKHGTPMTGRMVAANQPWPEPTGQGGRPRKDKQGQK